MKQFLFGCVFLLVLVSPGYAESVGGFDIILIGGQSNASNAGVGQRLDPLEGKNDERIFQLSCDDQNGNSIQDPDERSELSQDLSHVQDCWSGAPNAKAIVAATRRLGFGVSFARQYAARSLAPDRKVLLISNAVPGSGSSAWANGYMANLIWRTRKFLASPGKHRIVAMLWSQGEAEIGHAGLRVERGQYDEIALQGFIDEYRNRVSTLFHKLRSELAFPELPILLSEHPEEWTQYPEMRRRFQAVDRTLATSIGSARIVATNGLSSNPLCVKPDPMSLDCEDAFKVHFSASSMVELGRRYYEEWKLGWRK